MGSWVRSIETELLNRRVLCKQILKTPPTPSPQYPEVRFPRNKTFCIPWDRLTTTLPYKHPLFTSICTVFVISTRFTFLSVWHSSTFLGLKIYGFPTHSPLYCRLTNHLSFFLSTWSNHLNIVSLIFSCTSLSHYTSPSEDNSLFYRFFLYLSHPIQDFPSKQNAHYIYTSYSTPQFRCYTLTPLTTHPHAKL